jgi:hypothetical protein
MSSLITEYSAWYIFLCIATGLGFAVLLYRKENKFKEAGKSVIKLMFALRFISISLISFLLLSPILKTIGKRIENPIIIYAQDNSESLEKHKNLILNISKQTITFFKNHSTDYLFKTVLFGETVKKENEIDLKDKQTDISNLITTINNTYFNRNIAAIILASDGINNKGSNPEYETENIHYPIYTIALGDTSIQKDLVLSGIKSNKVSFLNHSYPIEINVKANKLKGKETQLKIYENDKLIKNQNIKINEDVFYKTLSFDIQADKVGFHKLIIKLDTLFGEVNILNNEKQIITEIIDSKQKILILANSPHPDLSALKQAIELNRNFEIETFLLNDFKKNINTYNLLILHQIPANGSNDSKILSELLQSNLPVIFILGEQSSLQKFDNMNIGLKTGAYANSNDNVQGTLNKDFSLFKLNPEIETISLNSPPLLSPFGEYKVFGIGQILFSRTIKTIDTKQALIAFNPDFGGRKSAVITGEGIWRWRITDYKLNSNHYLFNELINKSIQYLIQNENKEIFTIITEKIFSENEAVKFKAEIRNSEHELINEPLVKLKITDSQNQSEEFIFNKKENTYFLQTGKLKPGDYRWKAETVFEGKTYQKEGIFAVLPLNIESENLTADHNLLYKISVKTGGELFYPNQLSKLFETIQNNNNIAPVAYSEKKTESLINFKLIFFLIIILLASEWFMRKYNGGY